MQQSSCMQAQVATQHCVCVHKLPHGTVYVCRQCASHASIAAEQLAEAEQLVSLQSLQEHQCDMTHVSVWVQLLASVVAGPQGPCVWVPVKACTCNMLLTRLAGSVLWFWPCASRLRLVQC